MKPIKPSSRAHARLIKKGKNENRNTGNLLWPRDIRLMAAAKQSKI